MSNDSDILTMTQASEIADRHPNYISLCCKRGEIPSKFDGYRRTVKRSDLLAWMSRPRQRPGRQPIEIDSPTPIDTPALHTLKEK